MSNPYSKNVTGYRKWEWLNIRKPKATNFGKSVSQCVCGDYKLSKYRGRLYCSHCGRARI